MTSKQISFLRGKAHKLNAVVMIGNNGLSESVLNEINANLNAHELVKIKVQSEDRALRVQMYVDICNTLNAIAVHHIGKQLVVYRKANKPKIIVVD